MMEIFKTCGQRHALRSHHSLFREISQPWLVEILYDLEEVAQEMWDVPQVPAIGHWP